MKDVRIGTCMGISLPCSLSDMDAGLQTVQQW